MSQEDAGGASMVVQGRELVAEEDARPGEPRLAVARLNSEGMATGAQIVEEEGKEEEEEEGRMKPPTFAPSQRKTGEVDKADHRLEGKGSEKGVKKSPVPKFFESGSDGTSRRSNSNSAPNGNETARAGEIKPSKSNGNEKSIASGENSDVQSAAISGMVSASIESASDAPMDASANDRHERTTDSQNSSNSSSSVSLQSEHNIVQEAQGREKHETPDADTGDGLKLDESSTDSRERSMTHLSTTPNSIFAKSSVPYTIPEWNFVPKENFFFEVLKNGVVVSKLDVNEKGAYMFGRHEKSDFVLDHPSISRFHCVVQYREPNFAFLYDLNSTHGTYLNKSKIKSNIYVPLHVGDTVKFGQSSRIYLFQGPIEFMPEEGFSKAEIKRLKEIDKLNRLRTKEGTEKKEREHEVSWGFREDAIEEEDSDEDGEMDWKNFKGEFTESQKKLVEKVKKRQEKVYHLQKENERIQSKESTQGSLTSGQQFQISRNQQRLQQILEELEGLEESLNDSLQESVNAKKNKSTSNKKYLKYESDEDLDSDDDEFFDRAKKKKKPKSSKGTNQPVQVETAESLLIQKYKLILERKELKDSLVKEEKEKLEKEKNGIENPNNEKEKPVVQNDEDSLDAFMNIVSSKIVKEGKSALENRMKSFEESFSRVSRLLKISDPWGDFEKRFSSKIFGQPENLTEPSDWHLEKISKFFTLSKKQTSFFFEEYQMKDEEEGKEVKEEVGNEQGKEVKITDVNASELKRETENGDQTGQKMKYNKECVWLGAKMTSEKEMEGGDRLVASSAVESKQNLLTFKHADGEDTFVSYKEMKKGKHENRLQGTQGQENEIEIEIKQVEDKVEENLSLLLKHSRNQDEQDVNVFNDEDENDDEGKIVVEDKIKRKSENDDEEKEKKSKKNEKKKRRKLGPFLPKQMKEEEKNFVDWLPPSDQSGDGVTSLNSKFGY